MGVPLRFAASSASWLRSAVFASSMLADSTTFTGRWICGVIIQGLGDVTGEFDIRPVPVVEIGGQNIDMDDLALFVRIPFGRPVFHRIVTHSDDLRGVEETVAGRFAICPKRPQCLV
jgi:hypothetical protein